MSKTRTKVYILSQNKNETHPDFETRLNNKMDGLEEANHTIIRLHFIGSQEAGQIVNIEYQTTDKFRVTKKADK